VPVALTLSEAFDSQFVNLKDYREKYGFTNITTVAVLFEGVGLLLKQGLIDIKMVDRLFGPTMRKNLSGFRSKHGDLLCVTT
jgi:hypothetical protein